MALLSVRKAVEEALANSTRAVHAGGEAGYAPRPYVFIPFNQERDSIGRLISTVSTKGARPRTTSVHNRQPHIDYSSFKLNLFEHRPITAGKSRVGRNSEVRPMSTNTTKRLSLGSKRYEQAEQAQPTEKQERIKSPSPSQRHKRPQIGSAVTELTRPRFSMPLQINNHITLRGFVRTEDRQRPYSVMSMHKKDPQEQEESPIKDTGIIIPQKIRSQYIQSEQDIPRILRLQSTSIRDTPEQMHEKFKLLVSRVEQTRKNIEDLNIWAVPKSMWK